MLCDETKEHTAYILIPHERVITLVFWYQKRLVGDVPFHLKFDLKLTHPRLKSADFTQSFQQYVPIICRWLNCQNTTDLDNELALCAFTSARSAEHKHHIRLFSHNSRAIKYLQTRLIYYIILHITMMRLRSVDQIGAKNRLSDENWKGMMGYGSWMGLSCGLVWGVRGIGFGRYWYRASSSNRYSLISRSIEYRTIRSLYLRRCQ